MARDSMREESPGQTADGEPPAGRQTGRAGGIGSHEEGKRPISRASLPPSFPLSLSRREARRGEGTNKRFSAFRASEEGLPPS